MEHHKAAQYSSGLPLLGDDMKYLIHAMIILNILTLSFLAYTIMEGTCVCGMVLVDGE